mgnify:CR=1 FL=1
MHIKCTNEGTQALKRPWMQERVEFATTGTAQVEQSVGERLVDELPAIERYESDSGDSKHSSDTES